MVEKKKPDMPLGVGILSFLLFSCLAFTHKSKFIESIDQTVISFVQGFESPYLTNVMKFFTSIGSMSAVAILSLLMILFLFVVLMDKKPVFLFAAVMIGAPVLNRLLKKFFQRERPDFHRLIEIGGYSFPSGHAMMAMAFYGIITYLLWRQIPQKKGRVVLVLLCSVFILMIGISRIYLGVHYPSDILGGYLEGIFWITVSISIFRLLNRTAP